MKYLIVFLCAVLTSPLSAKMFTFEGVVDGINDLNFHATIAPSRIVYADSNVVGLLSFRMEGYLENNLPFIVQTPPSVTDIVVTNDFNYWHGFVPVSLNNRRVGVYELFVDGGILSLGRNTHGGARLGVVNYFNTNTYYPGDANLDHVFDSVDLIEILARGHWEKPYIPWGPPPQWEDGDFNADRTVNSADLIYALGGNTYGNGPSSASVPEPTSIILLLIGLLCLRYNP